MSVNLNDYVSEHGDGWAAECPVTDGTCGADGRGFVTTGWPTKKSARARLDEHVNEHKTGEPASSLEDFRAKHGVGVDADGRAVVTAKDL